MKPPTPLASRQAGSSSLPSRTGGWSIRTAVIVRAARPPAWRKAEESEGDCRRSAAATTSISDDLPHVGAAGRYPRGSAPVLSPVASRASGFGQQLLEQRQRARVAGLAEPEQRLAPYARLRVCAGDADEGGDPGVVRLLRQGEDRLLLHVPVHVSFVDQVGEAAGRGVAGSLAEPKHRLAAGASGRAVVARELQEQRPHSDRVREGQGQNGLFSPPGVLLRREAEQEVHGVARRDGAEV